MSGGRGKITPTLSAKRPADEVNQDQDKTVKTPEKALFIHSTPRALRKPQIEKRNQNLEKNSNLNVDLCNSILDIEEFSGAEELSEVS